MTKAEELFHQIAHELPVATEGKAFGVLCIKGANGKLAALFWKESAMFKLSHEDENEALQLKGVHHGTHIYRPDRPMTGWVHVPFRHSSKWKELAKKSIAYVVNKK